MNTRHLERSTVPGRRLSLAPLSLLAFVIVAGCSDRELPSSPIVSGAPLLSIADGARGGHPEFFWLPPTVPTAPAASGSFDAGALGELAVEICQLDGDGQCTSPLLERLTSTSMPIPERVQLDAQREYYTVNWMTGPSHIDHSLFYRVQVLRGTTVLGHLDVDPVKNTPQLSGVDRSKYVGVVAGQQLTLRFRLQLPTARTYVKLNEVESNGGVPGDWVELYNTGGMPLSLAGYIVKDNDDAHAYTIPAGTTIPANGFFVLDEAALGFGLDDADAARLLTPDGATVVDSYAWTAVAPTSYGRCPDGTGAFRATGAVTKGAANDCSPPPSTPPWPGDATIANADGTGAFGGGVSGLVYEGSGTAAPGVMWGVRHSTGLLYRLVFNGTFWQSEFSWGFGKRLRYMDGTGAADAEGVTFGGGGSVDGMYVAAERSITVPGVSRNSILRYDPNDPNQIIPATHEWDLTADLPATAADAGLEGITWVPDAYLVARGFFDESKGRAYLPADYANHGTGLFFVGLEANGSIYAYALNHADNSFTRVATFASGFPNVMELSFDRELNQLWALCDNGCEGRAKVLAPASGRFIVTRTFERPTGMPNLANEGFAITPQAECVSGFKPVYWADEAETSAHAIRRGTVTCTPF
jgi:hypothetical protein